jgi:predicted NAD-dependent protein-ADP-ribosyltransferase YbiA (DUF1768 family)
MVFPSTEHAYQAAKTDSINQRLVFCDPGMTCGHARKLGQLLELRRDWLLLKLPVMYSVTLDKYTRHLELQQKLLATGDAKLIEGNTWGDTFWGVCRGQGHNSLGLIIMSVRDRLREEAARG